VRHPTTILEEFVLQVSESAVSVLREARAAQEVPDTFGVRVFAQADETGQAALALAFADEPAEGDQVTEQDGTEIYVASELAEPLAESRLDVEQTPEGPQLALVPQNDEEQ
jgi:Fe-S cluster assembly iron-binding protein IscA